jgi:hypothetical protein
MYIRRVTGLCERYCRTLVEVTLRSHCTHEKQWTEKQINGYISVFGCAHIFGNPGESMEYVIKGQVIKKERSGALAKKLTRRVIRHHASWVVHV